MGEFNVLKEGKIICFDVDNTIVDSGSYFSLWLTRQPWFVYQFKDKPDAINYAWTEYTAWEGINLSPEHIQLAKNWWKQENLYEHMNPMQDVQEALEELHSLGHQIIFASHCEGHHGKSKVEFLKKFFPYMSGFLATRQKQFVRCDVLVDDRAYNLINLPDGVLPIYKATRYNDYGFDELSIDVPILTGYESLKEMIK